MTPSSPTWVLVAGARPNFMKIAPLMAAIRRHNEASSGARIRPILVHTGQHYDEKMSEVFFRELGMAKPDVNLEVGSGSHAAQTAQVMLRFEPVCLETRPDWLIVVGDVNSTVACALVAAKLGIRTAHVEAGLRSFDRSMPEEINRLVTDAISDLLLTPSEDADANLAREGIPPERVRRVGNIMIDALVQNLPKARQSGILSALGVKPKEFVYVTLHRPSNVDDPAVLRPIFDELKRLSRQLPIVFPIHPRTRKRVEDFGIRIEPDGDLRLVEPLGYHDSLCLAENARFVLTDSGGLQEETTYLQTPCLTLRPNTERPITLTHGSNKLTSLAQLSEDIAAAAARRSGSGRVPPLWDGATADRIVREILSA